MEKKNVFFYNSGVIIFLYMASKKFLKSIYENGKSVDFVEFLLKQNSIVISDYAKIFCNKNHLKPIERNEKEEEEHMQDIIRIVHIKWLD